jgi:hypothetical protein
MPGRCTQPTVVATICAIDSASSADASSHNHAPSAKRGTTSAAASIASRVLPGTRGNIRNSVNFPEALLPFSRKLPSRVASLYASILAVKVHKK